MTEFHFFSAHKMLNSIHNRSISVETVINKIIERIEEINIKLNALVYYNKEELIKQAKTFDKHLSRGNKIGPLHGLPVTIKDNLEVQRMITTGGIKGRKEYIPSFDATVVKRLKDAGAIILGKTNCPAYSAGFETTNEIYGRTNNPYNLDRTVGSSSGGEAALIAAGGSYLGIGTDTGGSIRWPSTFCGLASLIPTFGSVPRTGTIPYYLGFLDSTCVGPMARSVKDLILAFSIIKGPDNWDPRCFPLNYQKPDAIKIEGLNVAYYDENGFVTPDPSVKQVISKAANILTEKDIMVDKKYPLVSKEFVKISQGLNSFTSGIDPQTASELQMAQKYEEHIEYYPTEIYNLANQWLELSKKVKGDKAMIAVEYHFWSIKWDVYRSKIMQFMKKYDAIICPISAKPAFRHGESTSEGFNGLELLSYTHPYSLVGLPSVTIRGGQTADGLPIGFQIITNHGKEGLALKIALFLEEKLGGWKKPPL